MLQQSQAIFLALCTVHSVAQAMFPVMYEHGYDGNYGGKMIASMAPIGPPPIEQIQPAHEMHVPVQYEWKEGPFHGDDDYYRWLFGNRADNFGYRHGKQTEFIYPNVGSNLGHSHASAFKYSDHEQGHTMEQENIPITILFKSPSTPINLHQQHLYGDGSIRHEYNDNMPPHLIHRVTKPVITEIHEIITPYRSSQDMLQFKDDFRMAPHSLSQPQSKFPVGKLSDVLTRNYSLMKDKNSHNFGVFNKLYDLSLQMNKANGYVLNASPNQASQGHVESDIDEPESDANNEESSNSQPA